MGHGSKFVFEPFKESERILKQLKVRNESVDEMFKMIKNKLFSNTRIMGLNKEMNPV